MGKSRILGGQAGKCLKNLVIFFFFLFREFSFCSFSLFLFLAVLGLHCCMGLSVVGASGGYSLRAVRGLLVAVASLVAEHGL